MNLRKWPEKIVYGFAIFLVFSFSSAFAELPTGPIEITIENVTINTPQEPSEDSGNEKNKYLDEAVTQGLTIIGVVITTTVGGVYAYIQRKTTPSTLEQENMFNEIMKEAYYESYLPNWRKIWEIINSQDTEQKQQDFIDYLWKHYFGKRLIPTVKGLEKIMKVGEQYPAIPPLPLRPGDARDALLSWAQLKIKKSHLNSIHSDEPLLRLKLTHLFNSSDVKYYEYIIKNLPTFVERAVLATDDPTKYKTPKDIDPWKEDALKDLKRLMIFAFLREDEKVLKIMIKKEINKIISERMEPKSDVEKGASKKKQTAEPE